MSLAVAGHGASIAIEKDPTGGPGVFTEVAELNGDIQEPGYNRPWTETTPHQDTIDSGVTGRLGRDAVTFSVNFVHDNDTHDHLTGLESKIINQERFGIRFRGPGGGASDDEIIASGEVISLSITNPVREGARTAEVTIRLSKEQLTDGVSVGTAV